MSSDPIGGVGAVRPQQRDPAARSASASALSRRFPAVPDPLQQPTLTLGLLLGGVVGVDLSGLSIYYFVGPVCLSNAVGQCFRFPVAGSLSGTIRSPGVPAQE